MNRQPYAVQTAALNARRPDGSALRGFNYFMEQGLGKTGTAYMDFLDLVAQREVTRMVVICPNSFKGGWKDEAEEWGFDVAVFVYTGDEWSFNQWMKKGFNKPPVLVVNYEAIRPKYIKSGKSKKQIIPSRGMELIFRFMEGKKVYLASDESIQISTFDAAQTDGALLIAERAEYTTNLSGKPIKQGPHDMWSQLKFIKHMSMNYYAFRNSFCRMGGFKGKKVVGAANEEKLAEIIDPVTFRATKADWTDLPPKISMPPIEYEMTPEMWRHYKTMENDFIVWLNEEQEEYVTIDAALTKYIKLAQIQAGFIFDENKTARWLVEPSKNPRLNALDDWLKNYVPGKAIVVYNHKPVRDMLADRFAALNPVFIHGGMDDATISANKRTFNGDRDCRIIFITKSAKYGHTLLGDQSATEHACADMAFFENTYSLDDRSQLEDRPHRHGQAQDSMRYWDFAGTPLDRDCVKALQHKEGIFQAVFAPLRRTGR